VLSPFIDTLISLFIKFSALSFLAFGGVNALLPALYELSVTQGHWITAQTFADYFAIANAAPGPNFLTITLIGWHVGGILGALISTIAISWPSSVIIYFVQRHINNMQDLRKQKTIQYAAAGLAVGLVLASAWEIALHLDHNLSAYILTIGAIAITFFTRVHPLYLIGLGAILGSLGLV
jgi:chromate transporter